MAMNQDGLKNDEGEPGGGGARRQAEPGEFIPEPGKAYTVRFLPRDIDEYETPKGAPDFAFRYFHHYSYTRPDGLRIFDIPCPKTESPARACPICDYGWQLWNSKIPAEKELARKFLKQTRALLNLIDITTAESVAKGIQWWRAPIKKVYEEVKKYVLNPQWYTDGKDILDLIVGKNFTLQCLSDQQTKSGFQDYVLTPSPQPFDINPYFVNISNWRQVINGLTTHRPPILTLPQIEEKIGGPIVGAKPSAVQAPGAAPGAGAPGSSVAPPPAAPPAAGTAGASAPPPAAPPVAGALPVPAAPPAAPPAAGAALAPAAPPTAPPAGGPQKACFGEKFVPRSAECKACADKKQCMDKFLNNG